MESPGMIRHPAESHLYIIEIDVPDQALSFSIDQDAVFSFAQYIIKINIAHRTHIRIFFSAQHRNGNGFCCAPVYLRLKQSGRDRQILENHIFNATRIPQLQGDAPVGAGDHTVFHQNIAEKRLTFAAEFDGCTGGYQSAIADSDIFTGAILHGSCRIFKHDAVVSALNMAVGNADIAAVIRINTITICHAQIIINTDTIDQHILTPHQMHRPEGTVLQRHIDNAYPAAVLHKDHRRSGIKAALNMPLCDLAVINTVVTMDGSKSGDRHILTVLGVEEKILRCTGIFAVFVRRDMGCFRNKALCLFGQIIFQMVTTFEHCTHFQMQFQIGAQIHQTAPEGSSTGNRHPSTTGCCAGIDCCLDGSSVIGAAITDSAKVQNIIAHNFPPGFIFSTSVA